MIKNSSIYTGTVIHKRFKPKIHSFNYKVFSLLIDLEELELMHKELKLFSYNKFNIISFLIVIMVLETEVLLKTGFYKILKKTILKQKTFE